MRHIAAEVVIKRRPRSHLRGSELEMKPCTGGRKAPDTGFHRTKTFTAFFGTGRTIGLAAEHGSFSSSLRTGLRYFPDAVKGLGT